ncbi:adenosylcobinamide amidohydrolase [Paenisporosarcina indica]|uniref:adenosylcobinamide amidohydrolase n=1 Tax=Paenisporosarcina indica TaxID=650093 RepID=UPI00094F7DF6|nr:adenosylcobinamide amidohydrolase [Paenisporosarcina indica]
MIKVEGLTGGYHEVPVLKNVSFQVAKGEMLGILGPNGSGKSTLLKVMSGVLPLKAGTVELENKAIKMYTSKELARHMAVLPQLHANAFSHTVRETVSLGRYPHQSGFFSSWSDQDEKAIQDAMQLTGVKVYENKYLDELSGGEQQRVFVAQALAQQAKVILLDEPTNHLDIAHQKQLLDTIKMQATENGLTIISVFHDINLASLYCDRLLLMENGAVKIIDEPHAVLKQKQIESVYKARVSSYPHPEQPKPQITLLPDLGHSQKNSVITKEHFSISDDCVVLQTKMPLKTISSAVVNAGSGWFRTFVNRHVPADYACNDSTNEMYNYLEMKGFPTSDTVGMMTAVQTKDVVIEEYHGTFGSILIAVTAGVGNAVDVSKAFERDQKPYVGTINTWIIVNGQLSDEAFIQAMITATEAKTKALQSEDVRDPITNTVATGTSTDSLLVAASQKGELHPYAGPITELGKYIGRGVFECTTLAIKRYKVAKGM